MSKNSGETPSKTRSGTHENKLTHSEHANEEVKGKLSQGHASSVSQKGTLQTQTNQSVGTLGARPEEAPWTECSHTKWDDSRSACQAPSGGHRRSQGTRPTADPRSGFLGAQGPVLQTGWLKRTGICWPTALKDRCLK